MEGALIILGVTLLAGLLLYWYSRRGGAERHHAAPEKGGDEPKVCCGRHLICEHFETLPERAEYFDDEELDAYRDREPDAYTDAEIDEFRDVMLTMQPRELPAWTRSLALRGIHLPTALRDELLMLVQESLNTTD